MVTKQAVWKLAGTFGDVNPIEYGGGFIFEDTSRVYAPECERITPNGETYNETWTVHRFIMEPCTFINGILSDNKFHPNIRAWFADGIGEVSNFCGIPTADFIDMLVNGNAQSKAIAWNAIGDYFGFENLDAYPLTLTREEITARVQNHPYLPAS